MIRNGTSIYINHSGKYNFRVSNFASNNINVLLIHQKTPVTPMSLKVSQLYVIDILNILNYKLSYLLFSKILPYQCEYRFN